MTSPLTLLCCLHFNGCRFDTSPPHHLLSSLQCGTINDGGPNDGLTERSLQDAQRLYLMNDVVQPESVDPLVMQDDVRFSNLVVDIVQGMDSLYHVIYISTGVRPRGLLIVFDLFISLFDLLISLLLLNVSTIILLLPYYNIQY